MKQASKKYGNFHRLHLINKHITISSHEILKASMLDLLFEKKNKMYGAYTLRKYYPQRMSLALAISISGAMLLFFLLSNNRSYHTTTSYLPKDTIVLRKFEVPKTEPPVPEPMKQIQSTSQVASVKYRPIDIVPDHNLPVADVPTIEDIGNAAVSNITQHGIPDDGQPVHAISEALGNHTAIPDPGPTGNFDPVEKLPEFPGGKEAWAKFLSRYLQVPEELQAGERRTVQVKFWVSATGEVTQFEIIQSAGNSFDREVIRVLKKMPRWKPAIQNGHAIALSFVQPVTFQAFEE